MKNVYFLYLTSILLRFGTAQRCFNLTVDRLLVKNDVQMLQVFVFLSTSTFHAFDSHSKSRKLDESFELRGVQYRIVFKSYFDIQYITSLKFFLS